MTKYRVWSKYSQDKDDAIEIDADEAQDAAIEWCKLQDEQGNYINYYIDMTVHILDEKEHLSVYTVYAKPVPEFHAYEGEEL